MVAIPSLQKVFLFEETGDSVDVLKYADLPTPQIENEHDIIIKNKYAGVNFIEAYFRKGIYPVPSLPYVLGREAVGEIVAIGKSVSNFEIGDKVVYLSPSTFAQYTKIQDSHIQINKLDANISDEQLQLEVAAFLQGLTALSLIEEAYTVQKGDFVLVWAAAGGVGKILVQLLHKIGANIIALASSEEKLAQVKRLGADYLVNSLKDDIPAKIKEFTNGKGVEVSFDSIGKDTFKISLDLVKRKGTFVSYGNSSGPVPPFSISRLSAKNLKIVRPTLYNYIATQEEFEYYSTKLSKLIKSGHLKIDIHKVYPLSEYKQAALDLEDRKTTGKLILAIPQ